MKNEQTHEPIIPKTATECWEAYKDRRDNKLAVRRTRANRRAASVLAHCGLAAPGKGITGARGRSDGGVRIGRSGLPRYVQTRARAASRAARKLARANTVVPGAVHAATNPVEQAG